ncbi:MAG: hypothetical protein ACLRQY_03725 [[Clostridium] leptum]
MNGKVLASVDLLAGEDLPADQTEKPVGTVSGLVPVKMLLDMRAEDLNRF